MARGQDKQLSNEQRKNIVNMVVNRGKSLIEVSKDLSVKYNTVARVVRTFLREERLERKKRPGRRAVYLSPIKNMVEQFYADRPQATLLECKKHLSSKMVNPPSLTTINRILAKREISVKSVSVVPPQRNSPETIEKRRKYALKFTRLEADQVNFVYIDEFGCSIALRRGRARSKVGSPAIVIGPGRGRNLSVIAAIDINGPIHFMTRYGSVDQAQFINFLTGLIDKLDGSKDNVLVFDNLSVHKGEEVRKFMKERKFCSCRLTVRC